MTGARLLDALMAVPLHERDAWVDRMLGLTDALPEDRPELPRDAVPYLPCGVDAIVRVVREAPIGADDVFVDLGSGLGRPALLVHLLTGARAIGVELQPHLVAQARRCAERVGARGVRFIEGDATAVDVAEGTVFFIYSSFNGPALERVLARLRRGVLCAVDFEVPGLKPRASSTPELVFYDLTASAPTR